MNRVYKDYREWEDFKNGMYETICHMDREPLLRNAINFLTDSEGFAVTIERLLVEWPNAVAHNMTNEHKNRQAWLGQAAICFELGIPEDLTREAWNRLSDKERAEANRIADIAINRYENEK